ncbi:MAG: peroxidase family protein [Pyrinomonadaceae bacterium]
MARVLHGAVVTIEQASTAASGVAKAKAMNIPFSMEMVPDFKKFDFLFPGLQNDPANLLPTDPQTVADLKRLGQTMLDDSPRDELNSAIPAGYTYLGQFIDHDVTFEVASGDLATISDPNLAPLSLSDIKSKIRNTRSATLDLDSVYEGLAPRDGDKMLVGENTPLNGAARPTLRPAGKDDNNDLPRRPRSPDIAIDREALIGDPRNDENTVVSQLHTAFLRAHNAIVDRGNDFTAARKLLRQHYQWIVIHDFLPRICDPAIVAQVLNANKIFRPDDAYFFMPLEFTAAAYRFGHTMIRADYDFNVNFNTTAINPEIPATLELLFTFTALSGGLGDFDTLPDNWIIEWEHFVETGGVFNFARRLDTKLVEPLFTLRNFEGQPLPDEARLAVRNLLRGYLLRMPTGQAVAKAIGATPLTSVEMIAAAASSEQSAALTESGFDTRTPLWYYVLAEAAQVGGEHLGPVGSTIVAEVLIGLIRRSEDSILSSAGWSPSLGATSGKFELPDLLRLAAVL